MPIAPAPQDGQRPEATERSCPCPGLQCQLSLGTGLASPAGPQCLGCRDLGLLVSLSPWAWHGVSWDEGDQRCPSAFSLPSNRPQCPFWVHRATWTAASFARGTLPGAAPKLHTDGREQSVLVRLGVAWGWRSQARLLHPGHSYQDPPGPLVDVPWMAARMGRLSAHSPWAQGGQPTRADRHSSWEQASGGLSPGGLSASALPSLHCHCAPVPGTPAPAQSLPRPQLSPHARPVRPGGPRLPHLSLHSILQDFLTLLRPTVPSH